jgi:hypothetical protein
MFGHQPPGFYLIGCSTAVVLAVAGWFESPVSRRYERSGRSDGEAMTDTVRVRSVYYRHEWIPVHG